MRIAGLSPLLLRAGLRYQLRHRWQALLSLSGIVMGVAVVLAVDLANSAAKASFALSSAQLRGAATHRIVGVGGEMPDSVYRQLYTTPGHPPMAPVITARVKVAGQAGQMRLVGLDLLAEGSFRDGLPELIQGTASLARWLSRPGLAALSTSASKALNTGAGGRLTLSYQGRDFPLEVMAISTDDSLGSRNLIVVDIATAQTLTNMHGRLSHIDVILDDEAMAWTERHLPPTVRLLDVSEQARDTVGLSASFELNLTAMSLLALMVGMFLIFNAISFSIVQRRNLLGRLRALGVRPRELAALVLIEAMILAMLGTLIGTLLGYWLGRGLTQIVAATVSEFYYDASANAMRLSGTSVIKAWGLGVAGTLAAAWLPAHQAAKTPPLTTLSRAALEDSTRARLPWLAGVGGLLLLCGLVISLRLPGGVSTGFAGLFIMLMGAALTTPMALRLSHRLLSRLQLQGVWQLAIRNLDRHLSRLSTAAAALMIALAASVGVAVMVDSMRGAVSDWLRDLLTADFYIAAEGFEDGATLPDGVFEQTSQIMAAGDISTYRKRILVTDAGRIVLVAGQLAARSRQGFRFVDVDTTAPWTGFEAGELLISEPLAYRLKLGPGDTLALPTATGERLFRVAAVFRDFASEHGRVLIDSHHYRRLWDDQRIDTLALFAHEARTADLLHAARQQLSDNHNLVFTAAGEIFDESMAVFEQTFRITEVLRLLSVLVAFVGVFSALMALQLERRREYAILRALGLTRGQISALTIIESVVLGLIAALLAVPTGLAMAWILTAAIQLRAFGWSMPFLASSLPLLLTLLIGMSAAALASLYPAWQAAQRDPAPQLREE